MSFEEDQIILKLRADNKRKAAEREAQTKAEELDYYEKHIAMMPENEIQELYAPYKVYSKKTGEVIRYEEFGRKRPVIKQPDASQVIPQWLVMMKDALIDDAKVVEDGLEKGLARNANRLAALKEAGGVLAPELNRLELNALFDVLESKAGELRSCYREMIGLLKFEVDVEGMTRSFAEDRKAAALLLAEGKKGGEGVPERKLPADIMAEPMLRMTMSAEDMFAAGMEDVE